MFQTKIWEFYKKNKRDFPWRETTNPYHILVSEVMLQQTQTARVVEKYNLFIQALPTIHDLANASIFTLLSLWQGLGYNRRALYLQKAAQHISHTYSEFECSDVSIHHYMTPECLQTLPGIGLNTSASILVFSSNIPLIFIETNIRRVFIHEFFEDQTDIHDKQILPLIEQTLDQRNPREWYYALMDYGAHLPKLVTNPNRKSKHYSKQSKFEGSLRQVRGRILKELLNSKQMSRSKLEEKTTTNQEYFLKAMQQLTNEGFIEIKNNAISLKNSSREV